ncbi:MAG: hypothetical protein WCS06_10465 [Dysgonamonadaceae bacterium]
MRKLTRKSLDELAKTLPVIEESFQMSYVGGGDGTSISPYTQAEFDAMCSAGIWSGGYVEGWGYTFDDKVTATAYASSRPTGYGGDIDFYISVNDYNTPSTSSQVWSIVSDAVPLPPGVTSSINLVNKEKEEENTIVNTILCKANFNMNMPFWVETQQAGSIYVYDRYGDLIGYYVDEIHVMKYYAPSTESTNSSN